MAVKVNYGRYGFAGDSGQIFLTRCPQCDPDGGRENWGPAVATGQCAWCGFKPSHEELLEILESQTEKK